MDNEDKVAWALAVAVSPTRPRDGTDPTTGVPALPRLGARVRRSDREGAEAAPRILWSLVFERFGSLRSAVRQPEWQPVRVDQYRRLRLSEGSTASALLMRS